VDRGRKRTADASLFSLWLSQTFNNLQVSDGCVSPSKYVQVRLSVGCIVGCASYQGDRIESERENSSQKIDHRATSKLFNRASLDLQRHTNLRRLPKVGRNSHKRSPLLLVDAGTNLTHEAKQAVIAAAGD